MVGRRNLLKRIGAAGVVVLGGEAAVQVADAAIPDDQPPPVELPPRAYALVMVDRSGSMSKVREATIAGLNNWLKDQRDKPDLLVSLVQFDTATGTQGLTITETFGFMPAPDTRDLHARDYVPRGGTPLRAALVDGIARLEKLVRPQDRVLLCAQTDGEDTTSPGEITIEVVRELVKAKEAEGNWTFVFMGTDIDAWSEGGAIGMAVGNTQQYPSTHPGTLHAYATTSSGTDTWYHSGLRASKNFYATDYYTAGDVDVVTTPSTDDHADV